MSEQKPLPKIMYDQTQFTPIYGFDFHSCWMNDQTYQKTLKISGYAPQAWYLYTQSQPESFWFGAYDLEALNLEAEFGFRNFTDPEFVKNLENQLLRWYSQAQELARKYFKLFYRKEFHSFICDKYQLLKTLTQIRELNTEMTAYYLLTQPQRFYKFEAELKKIDRNYSLELLASTGRQLTLVMKIKQAIMEIAKKCQQQKISAGEFLEREYGEFEQVNFLIENQGLLNWGFFGGEIIDLKHIISEINHYLDDENKLNAEIEKINQANRDIELRNQVWSANQGKAEYQMAEIIGQAAVMRFDMQTYTCALIKYVDEIAKALAVHYRIAVKDITAYEFDELLELIRTSKRVAEDIIKQRQIGYLRIFTHEKIETLIGDAAKERIKELLEFRRQEILEAKDLKGSLASWPDKKIKVIQGRAFVMSTAHNADEQTKDFQDKDILVATQTHPNLVSIMKQAKAIVTDEGGLTCHAAIVSRELGVPCVIGTRLATKVIKTGDMIEINLEKAEVKKLKKSE